MKRTYQLATLLFALLFLTPAATFADDKHKFRLARQLSAFNSIVKELNLFYVDSIMPDMMINKGIDAMLRNLDPYTVYYPEEKNEELKMMTTGKYAGVGSTIRFHKELNTTVITGPYENMPAYKAGLRAGDAIVSIYMIPRSVLHATPTFVNVTINNITAHVASIATSSAAEDMGLYESTVNTSLNGYTPVNKKLLTWPYNYAYVTNNVGQNMELHYEDFYFGTLNTQHYYYIRTVGSLTPGCSIRCFPVDYKKKSDSTGTAYSYDHGITLGKFPICSWNTDTYTNWLTSQGANIGVGFAGSVASLAIGSGMILTGGGAGIGMGMAMAGIGGIASSIASVYSHSLVPHKEGGNTNSGDVTYSKGELKFVIHKMCIRPEYARIIDEYFSAYGYKVNRLKIPNVAGRLNWNFVKTIGCNVDGDVPQEDLLAIRKACDDGITFWHTPANIYNYSLSNTIVS